MTRQGGQLTLTYPALGTVSESKVPSSVSVEGRKLSARYENGAILNTELQDDGTLSFHFSALPDDVKNIRFDLPLPLTLNQGGGFAIDQRKAVAFPAAATPDAFLFKGDAKRLVLTPAAGDAFTIHIEHGWQQVQDNRVWNTDSFAWMATADLPRVNGSESYYTIRIAAPKRRRPRSPPAPPRDHCAPRAGRLP